MTDVTGFGLLGHLVEMCEGSDLSAEIEFQFNTRALIFWKNTFNNKSMPGGTHRNWESYGSKISVITEEQRIYFGRPSTSGGLLVSLMQPGQMSLRNFRLSKELFLNHLGS